MQYAAIPDYIKKNNIIFVLNGNKGYIKIPVDPGLTSFAQPIRNYVESQYLGDRQSLLETAKNIFVDPLLAPVGTNLNEVATNLIPSPVLPIAENIANYNFYTGH